MDDFKFKKKYGQNFLKDDRIVEKIEIRNIYKILIMAVMAFHPTFIILAGSINNDVLMILLSFYIILYLIKWALSLLTIIALLMK